MSNPKFTPKSENEVFINGELFVRKSSLPKAQALANPNKKMPFVMIRSYASGIHFGYLKSKKVVGDRYAVELVDSRRVWKWSGACSISQLAVEGSTDLANCKIAITIPLIEVTEIIEIIPLTSVAADQLKGAPIWKS